MAAPWFDGPAGVYEHMSDTPITPPEDDDLLAAEMALGLLEGEDRAAARTRLMQDHEFARRVAGPRRRCDQGPARAGQPGQRKIVVSRRSGIDG